MIPNQWKNFQGGCLETLAYYEMDGVEHGQYR